VSARLNAWFSIVAAVALHAPSHVAADTLELTSGETIRNCFIRDEGTRLLVWRTMEEVGGPAQAIPRSQMKSFKVERDAGWDAKPQKADLSVTFIEITPKLAGLHGKVDYDKFGRPKLTGSPLIIDLGEDTYLRPEAAAKNLKLKYGAGEEVTFTAHVKNVGFIPAQPFRYSWLIDDREVAGAEYPRPLAEMEEVTFQHKWKWQDGMHHVTFRVQTIQPEIATINNELKDALWGLAFFYVVSKGRVAAWHDFRSAYGTFCFEDFYRWHIEIMNTLFAASVFPATPHGCRFRVRLDRIVYADQVRDNTPYFDGKSQPLEAADGIRYDQGGWYWNESEEELKTGKWSQVEPNWRNNTEWSLPHELGHQLGLIDWYNLDYQGFTGERPPPEPVHVMPDNGDLITHFMRHPVQMMHWHGPQVFGEVDAAYLNATFDKPRGYFGDMLFAIPRECSLQFVDINGQPVADAPVEIFQRGVERDPNAAPPPRNTQVRSFDVIEDGNFDPPVSKLPVIAGRTDSNGVLPLPNRPVQEVKTLNGFHREPNPFGNLNVVGQRGLLLVKIVRNDRPCWFYLEIHDFNLAWFRGDKQRHTFVLKTPYGSVDSPRPPVGVKLEKIDEHHVKVSWSPPLAVRDAQYLDRAVGYRVCRRISSDGLNDRPWFEVATLGPQARKCIVDLRERPDDIYWFSKAERFGVATVGEGGVLSELVEAVLR
jgi:hypothetical protein